MGSKENSFTKCTFIWRLKLFGLTGAIVEPESKGTQNKKIPWSQTTVDFNRAELTY